MSHASRCLPAFLAATHLVFIANASRFRPASLNLPRRERDGTATRFGVPAWAALFAAQRLLVRRATQADGAIRYVGSQYSRSSIKGSASRKAGLGPGSNSAR